MSRARRPTKMSSPTGGLTKPTSFSIRGTTSNLEQMSTLLGGLQKGIRLVKINRSQHVRKPYLSQADHHPLKPSANMNDKNRRYGSGQWLDSIFGVEAFLNCVFFMVHPELQTAGASALDYLKGDSDTSGVANSWSSNFMGIAVIINRRTPAHRDGGGMPPWYDLLLGCGSYEDCTLDLPDLGLKMDYGPRTGVFLCGNLLRHEVKRWGGQDRICYAQFMRRRVLDRFGLVADGWSTQRSFSSIIPDEVLKSLKFRECE
jgi:hypothetical protein